MKKKLKKTLYSLTLDLKWIKYKKIPIHHRICYILEKYTALLVNRRKINYLQSSFRYDNYATPVTLQSYPAEIFFLHSKINLDKQCSILDIGGNIGQFAITLASLFPHTKIYSFEANPFIYRYLQRNSKDFSRIKSFNEAIGPKGRLPFYYLPGLSGKGSFLQSYAVSNLISKRLRTIELDLIELTKERCQELQIPVVYDLIKIDVEGFEYSLLDGIRHIQPKYLYVEFTQGRKSHYDFMDLLNKIQKYFGGFRINYCDQIDQSSESTLGHLLVNFYGPKDQRVD